MDSWTIIMTALILTDSLNWDPLLLIEKEKEMGLWDKMLLPVEIFESEMFSLIFTRVLTDISRSTLNIDQWSFARFIFPTSD